MAAAAVAQVSLSGIVSAATVTSSHPPGSGAAAAAFGGSTSPEPPSPPAASSDTAGAHEAPYRAPPRRLGFVSSEGLALHPDTHHALALALATAPEHLHAWVAAQAEREQTLPEAFVEVWRQYERKEQALTAALTEGGVGVGAGSGSEAGGGAEVREGSRRGGGGGGGEKSAEAAGGPDGGGAQAEDVDLLDVETLQARLRRRMRHSMHVMMQQANPDSYYATNVVHPDNV